jgi:hypothetical protein
MARRIEQLNKVGGDGEQVLVASIRSDIPEDRFLKYGDPIGNAEKIQALTNWTPSRPPVAAAPR